MSFLNPLPLLICLAAIALPVAVHLLSRRRVETVYLPTFRFLFDVRATSAKRFRWLQGLFIFIRVLVVLIVLMLISRPLVHDSEQLLGSPSGELVLLVDASAGMDAITHGESSLDRAKRVIRRLLDQTATDRIVSLVRVLDRPQTRIDQLPRGRVHDREIDTLVTGAGRGNFYLALAERRDALPSSAVEYVFLTDLARNSFREFENTTTDIRSLIPSRASLRIIDVGSTDEGNRVAVLGDQPHFDRNPVGSPIPIQARVWNPSQKDVSATLRLVIDDSEIERRGLLLRPGQRHVETLSVYIPAKSGIHRGVIEIEPDDRSDPFPDDNQFRFVLQVQPPLKILIVNGNPSVEAHEDEVAYLKTAVQTSHSRESKTPPAFRVEVEREAEIVGFDAAQLGNRLKEVAVMILANCGAVTQNPDRLRVIREFVRDGGGLIVFPGDRVDPETYTSKLFQSNSLDPFFPARLGKPRGNLNAGNTIERLQFRDSGTSVLEYFDRQKSPQARPFEQTVIRRWFPLELLEGQGIRVLADLANESPAIVSADYGRGKVICSAFPVNSNWSNLPLRGHEFVPLIFSLVTEVHPRPNFEFPSSLRPSESLRISVRDPALLSGELVSPSSQRSRLEFEWSNGTNQARIENLEEPGFYSLRVRRDREHQWGWEGRFAVNLAEEESDFERITPEGLRAIFPEENVTLIDRTAERIEKGDTDRPREFWSVAILLALLLIAVEFLLTTPRGIGIPGQGT